MTDEDLIEIGTCSLPKETKVLLLRGYLECKGKDSFWEWEREIIEKVLNAANSTSEERVFCPLCGGGVEPWGWHEHQGFLFPEGLKRHLEGKCGATQCHLFATIQDKAHEYMRPIFQEEDRQNDIIKKNRRKNERLYKVDLGHPELYDEHNRGELRTKQELRFAESRLDILKFERVIDKNIISYQRVHNNFIIIADPRQTKSIEFLIFRRTPGGKPAPLAKYRCKRFVLPDAWKNEIPFKFVNLLERELRQLQQ